MITTPPTESSLIIRTAESLGIAQAHLISLLILFKVHAPELVNPASTNQYTSQTIQKINQFVIEQTGVNVLEK